MTKKPPAPFWLAPTIDCQAGRILLFMIGRRPLKRWRPVVSTGPRKMGLCVLGAIGNAVLASAVAIDLKQRDPSAHLTVISSKTNRQVAKLLLPQFDDLLLDANQKMRICLAGARQAISFRTVECSHYAFHRSSDRLGARREVENYRALLGPLGVTSLAKPEVPLDHHLVALLCQTFGRFVVLHLGAGDSNAA
jgi:hypothetical protein